MDRIDTLVIGAGVVGLAVARELALSGREVVVAEAAESFGTGTSSRNSGVIHAGIYYPQGSLKARMCVEGRERLYAFCADHGVEAPRIGKLIVATAGSQSAELDRLAAAARRNGVTDLESWTAQDVRAAEPEVTATRALFSPSTGIVDTHAYMLALEGDLEAAGGVVAYRTPFVRSQPAGGGHQVETGGDEPLTLLAREVVNCAGLEGSLVGRAIGGPLAAGTPPTFFARGCYFELTGSASPFRHLVYPVPEPGGLGVHATLDLGGRVRFGPDVEWIAVPSFEVAPGRSEGFYAAVRRYWPGLDDATLQPAYAGVRPKLSGPGAPATDFMLRDRGDGVIDMLGIESPGLTSSLALAVRVRAMLAR